MKESGVKIGSGWRRSLVEGRPLTSEAPRAQRGRPQSHLVGDGCPVSLFGVHWHWDQPVRGWHCAAATWSQGFILLCHCFLLATVIHIRHKFPHLAKGCKSKHTHKKRSRSVSLKYNPDYIKGFAHFLAATILEHRSIVTGNGARTTKLKFTMKCNRRSMCRSPSVVIRMRCIHLIYFIWQTDVCIYTSQRFYFHTIEGSVDVIPCLAVVVIRYLPIIYNVKHWKNFFFFI